MEEFSGNYPDITIKKANKEDLAELTLCADEFIDLIKEFRVNFLDGKYISLLTYYNKIVVAVLIAEELNQKVDSIENILPKTLLKLIYVNPNYRNKLIGTKLLLTFLKLQKEKGFASIYVKLPQKYKSGIRFFEINDFRRIGKVKEMILLEINLWNDFGLRFSQFLPDNFFHILD
jgi:GNAT superfamily N-acetyltransferase